MPLAARWHCSCLKLHTSSHDARYSLCEGVACSTPSARSPSHTAVTVHLRLWAVAAFSGSPSGCDYAWRHRLHLSHLRSRQVSTYAVFRTAQLRPAQFQLLCAPEIFSLCASSCSFAATGDVTAKCCSSHKHRNLCGPCNRQVLVSCDHHRQKLPLGLIKAHNACKWTSLQRFHEASQPSLLPAGREIMVFCISSSLILSPCRRVDGFGNLLRCRNFPAIRPPSSTSQQYGYFGNYSSSST